MADILNDEVVAGAAGGVNNSDPNGAHYRPNRPQGTEFDLNGHHWYVIKSGDFLGGIAQKFGTSVGQIQAWNPATITNVDRIYAGDAIIVRR